MLLPSTIGAGPRPRLQRFAAYSQDHLRQVTTPPCTPPTPLGVDGTCRALQSALGTRSAHNETRSPRRRNTNAALHANARILKRPPPRPRSILKRGRQDDDGSSEEEDSLPAPSRMMKVLDGHSRLSRSTSSRSQPSTPKRRRRDPPSVPFGLQRHDFSGLDEGIDEMMSEEAMSSDPSAIDEGYGSMDIQIDSSGEILGSHKRSRLEPSLFAPMDDCDAMSLNTPASDLAAMVLSPMEKSTGSHHDSTQHVFEPSTPDTKATLLAADPIRPHPAPNATCRPDRPDVRSADAHTINRELREDYFQARVSRSSDRIHSDPSGYRAASTPIRACGEDKDDNNFRESADTASEWTDADDRALVELVVEKLRLKQCDWDDCARLLGADNGASLGRRWKELVGDGCVGMKFRFSGVGFTAEDTDRRRVGFSRRTRPRGRTEGIPWR